MGGSPCEASTAAAGVARVADAARPGAATARAPSAARVDDEVLDLDKAADAACQID